ncbi:MAG: PRD domain-containing protein [Solobacterium sp.]|nr:PRD domain-containing protein [Solobacterium sp.]
MKDKQSLQLIQMLCKKKSAGGMECADALGISLSTFKRELVRMAPEYRQNGFAVSGRTGYGNGYDIQIFDESKFKNYLEKLKAESPAAGADMNDPETRVRYLIRCFLNPDKGYQRMEDLSEELMLSRTQLAKDIQAVRAFFEQWGLGIVSRPHYGSCLSGDEKALRSCQAAMMINEAAVDEEGSIYLKPHIDPETESILSSVLDILVSTCNEKTYDLNDITARDLSAHLAVAAERIRNGHTVVFAENIRRELLSERDRDVAAQFVGKMETQYGIDFSEDELCFVILHMSTRQMGHRSMITPEIQNLVQAMLEEVRNKHQLDLTQDSDLKTFLGMHTAAFLRRLHYGVNLTNPLLDDIRFSYIVSYDMALSACNVIAKKYSCRITADEAAYYALHFKIASDRRRRSEARNVLVVCSSGRGTAKLLDESIRAGFSSQIGRLDTCNKFELRGIDFSKYDCIFTTVELKKAMPLPVFQIRTFFDEANARIIANALAHRNIDEDGSVYFKEDLFFPDITAETKEEALRMILGRISSARALPAGFEESVFERESIQDTQYGAVAFPHPHGVVTEEPLISFTILQRPLRWAEEKVQIIILYSFPKEFEEENTLYFSFIRQLSRSRHFLRALIKSRSYETLLDLYEEVIRKGQNRI